MTVPCRGVTSIDAVIRTVPDLDAASRFYEDALDFVPEGLPAELSRADLALLGVQTGTAHCRNLRLGRQCIGLLAFTPAGRPYPADSTATDLWFQHCAIVVGDMARAHERVIEAGALPITLGGPQHLPANTGDVTAFKFRDPFGHPLELLGFPEGVGDAAWHVDHGGLFRGIDHTAIAVSSTKASRRFYETLGFGITDHTHNQGKAQARLDAVPEDEVEVMALAPQAVPPHLELLAYQKGPRRSLTEAGSSDAALSHTLASGDIATLAADLMGDAAHPSRLRHGTWNGRPAIAFQDPDGHCWICVAST